MNLKIDRCWIIPKECVKQNFEVKESKTGYTTYREINSDFIISSSNFEMIDNPNITINGNILEFFTGKRGEFYLICRDSSGYCLYSNKNKSPLRSSRDVVKSPYEQYFVKSDYIKDFININ